MTDLCDLITEMADELDHNHQCLLDDRRVTHPLADRARAALAEPADGEVAELVLWLREEADDYDCIGETLASLKCRRAASLLESLSPPQPISVTERLPGPEDCDAEGRCWWLKERANPDHDLLMPTWHLQRQGPAGTRFFRFTHWLPAHALPVPQ